MKKTMNDVMVYAKENNLSIKSAAREILYNRPYGTSLVGYAEKEVLKAARISGV